MPTPTVVREQPKTASGQRTFEVAGANGARYTVFLDRVLGSGSQGVVVEARAADGAPLAAKLYRRPSGAYAWRDRHDRRTVLAFLEDLVREHPLGAQHFRQTHLMPVFAHGTICADACGGDVAGEPAAVYDEGDVVVMARCERCWEERADVTFEEIRDTVVPQVSAALQLLHQQCIVHRDIKPGNLFTLDGQLVVGDFGIAAVVDAGQMSRDAALDRGTPGFLPRSSTVQCANDWYALGYTIWTLYNGGVHPCPDAEGSQADDRPASFVPREPAHASLGALIEGLICADDRERMGYEDVARWIADPEGFVAAAGEKDARAAGANTEGTGEKAAAVDARAAGTPADSPLEEAFSRAYAHRRSPAGNAGWHGAETPDACFALLSRTPLGFYRWMDGHGAGAGATREARAAAACANCDAGLADLVDLLGALAAMGCPEPARATAAWLANHPDAGAVERATRLLELFEAACTDPEPVRAFELRWGPLGHVGWLLDHANLYEGLDARGDDLLRRLSETPAPAVRPTAAQGRAALRDAEGLYGEVRAAAEAAPYLARVGITAPDQHLAARVPAARFSDTFYGIPVPAGYLDELLGASGTDEDAVEHALTALRGIHGARLNRAAAHEAFDRARQLDHLARLREPEPLVDGQTEAAHFANSLLYASAGLLMALAWSHLSDALEAQTYLFAGSGALEIPGVFVQALCELGLIGLMCAVSAAAVGRIEKLGERRAARARTHQIRTVADGLRADGAVLATGADAAEDRHVRIDVEEFLYELAIEDYDGDGALDGDGLDDDCADGGRPDDGGRFWRGVFWAGAAVCAACVGLASVGSVPLLMLDLVGLEVPGWLAQALYLLLGGAAFAGVVRVRPVRDPLTLALLACAPVLPYVAALGLVLAAVAGLACAALCRLLRLS